MIREHTVDKSDHIKLYERISFACMREFHLLLFHFTEENIEMMSDFGTIRLILLALKKHQEDARVVKNACMALATIVEADGECVVWPANCF